MYCLCSNSYRVDRRCPLGMNTTSGDSWLHRLDLTSRRRKPTDPPARVLNGARSGPLEDSGGMPGYEQILDTLANPSHEDHEQVSLWVTEITGTDESFDSEFLNLGEINRSLRQEQVHGGWS